VRELGHFGEPGESKPLWSFTERLQAFLGSCNCRFHPAASPSGI